MSYTRSLRRNYYGDWDLPSSRLDDQFFALGLNEDDFWSPSYYRRPPVYPMLTSTLSPSQRMPSRRLSSGGLSEFRTDPDKFQVLIDVSHFTPEEIVVKTVDDQVVVQANHEEKVDEHGYVSRQFTRRYMLPVGTEAESVKSTLNPEGILTIEAKRKKPQRALELNEKQIPISVQGGPPVQVAQEIPVQREEKKPEK